MVEALTSSVEKVLCARLEVNEVVAFHFVFYIIKPVIEKLIIAGRSLLIINVDKNCNDFRLLFIKKGPF